MIIYWWIITTFNVILAAYGVVVYILPCPHFYTIESCGSIHCVYNTLLPGYYTDSHILVSCSRSRNPNRTMVYTSLLLSLDASAIFSVKRPLFWLWNKITAVYSSLVYSYSHIWGIQMKWTQKIALGFSLCLTIMMIVVTRIRESGLRTNNVVDVVWGTYWQFISVEIGLIMTAMTALHSLFVTRRSRETSGSTWYTKAKAICIHMLPRRSRFTGPDPQAVSGVKDGLNNPPTVPGATLTGIHTYIKRCGKPPASSQIMQSNLSNKGEVGGIKSPMWCQHIVWRSTRLCLGSEVSILACSNEKPIVDRHMRYICSGPFTFHICYLLAISLYRIVIEEILLRVLKLSS